MYKRESGGLYGEKVVTNLGNNQVQPSKQYGGGPYESPAQNYQGDYQNRSPIGINPL
jgi:hypothetical protein